MLNCEVFDKVYLARDEENTLPIIAQCRNCERAYPIEDLALSKDIADLAIKQWELTGQQQTVKLGKCKPCSVRSW